MKKFFGTLAVLTIFTSQTFQHALAFPDVTPGSDLEQHVRYLTDKGILSGYPDGTFKPDRTINRAEALKIIFAVQGISANTHGASFPDVPSNEWFAPFISEAKKRNIIAGYPDGKFRPGQEVNRAEFVKMAMLSLPFFGNTPHDALTAVGQFSDVDGGQWYIPYVSAGLQLKFLPLSKQFKPTSGMQRRDAAEMIYHISQYIDAHPSSVSKNSEIPYVPEEAFVEINPLANHPKEFGPDKLYVRKDIGKTDISNFNAGYSLAINEIVHVENYERSADRMTLAYDRGCVVDIMRESTNGQNPQEIFQELNKDSKFMNAPTKKSIERLTEMKKVEAYEMTLEWEDGNHHKDVMVFTPSIYYLINGFSVGGASEDECDQLGITILSQFSFLQS